MRSEDFESLWTCIRDNAPKEGDLGQSHSNVDVCVVMGSDRSSRQGLRTYERTKAGFTKNIHWTGGCEESEKSSSTRVITLVSEFSFVFTISPQHTYLCKCLDLLIQNVMLPLRTYI